MALAACRSGSTATTIGTSTTVATSTTTTPNRVASSSPTEGNTAAVTTGKDPVVVGLGNSVPSGEMCSCVNFVSAYAAMVDVGTSTKATVENDAVSGSTSADAVNHLATGAVQAQVRSATTVLIMTGANDFNDAFDQVSLGAPAAETYGPVATA